MTPNNLDWQILDRFLAGSASPAEADQVRAWMSASAENRALVEFLQQDAATTPSVNVDRAWERVAARTVRNTVRAARPPMRRTVGFLAAAAVILVAGSIATRAALRGGAPAQQVAVTWNEIAAP